MDLCQRSVLVVMYLDFHSVSQGLVACMQRRFSLSRCSGFFQSLSVPQVYRRLFLLKPIGIILTSIFTETKSNRTRSPCRGSFRLHIGNIVLIAGSLASAALCWLFEGRVFLCFLQQCSGRRTTVSLNASIDKLST